MELQIPRNPSIRDNTICRNYVVSPSQVVCWPQQSLKWAEQMCWMQIRNALEYATERQC